MQIQDSYAEGDINNAKHFGRVAEYGYLWDRTSNLESMLKFDQCPQRCQCNQRNAITGYHYNDMKVKDIQQQGQQSLQCHFS